MTVDLTHMLNCGDGLLVGHMSCDGILARAAVGTLGWLMLTVESVSARLHVRN